MLPVDSRNYAAHLGQAEPHRLEQHLLKVGEGAAEKAVVFGGEYYAKLLGTWHDLGKYNPEFQSYLKRVSQDKEDAHLESEENKNRGPNHSSAGALHVREWIKKQEITGETAEKLAAFLAYSIMGHHAGLADYDGGNSSLKERLFSPDKDYLAIAMQGSPPEHILWPDISPVQDKLSCLRDGRDYGFFIRMLFSCLVDADFLDTEAYMSPEKVDMRGGDVTPERLLPVLESYLAGLGKEASEVNDVRAEVLSACRERAEDAPGFFSLSVPTGGGKTLSSLAFALKHAVRHRKRRVIYAIPYTSIIEQTAEVFRGVFREQKDAILEHHSNVSDPGQRDETSRQRLASENWDAPLVVTTTVQLFESFHAYRTSRCRKLHHIANSVIILDEAHLMPPNLRYPILFALHQLVTYYGVTVVFCTATPTGMEKLVREGKYIPQLRPIISDVGRMYDRLKRVQVIQRAGKVSDWGELAGELAQYPQVLCIVGRRDDCRELHAAMPEGAIHLSALMCAEHRSEVIKDIRQRLHDKRPVQVISTQLVEAGVDVDFPVVYRAMAGLDSIAQAAGRCNREGKQKELGKVVVFQSERPAPPGILKRAAQAAGETLRQHPGGDILSPELQRYYFERFYANVEGDEAKILNLNQGIYCQFREMAQKFRMIKDAYLPVIVRHKENDWLLHQLSSRKTDRWLLRRAQRYTVTLPERMVRELVLAKAVMEVLPGLYVQDMEHAPNLYDKALGLVVQNWNRHPPEDLVI